MAQPPPWISPSAMRASEIEHGDVLGLLQRPSVMVVIDDQDGQALGRRYSLEAVHAIRASRSSSNRPRAFVEQQQRRIGRQGAYARFRSIADGRRKKLEISWLARAAQAYKRSNASIARLGQRGRRRPCRSWCCRAARRRSRRFPSGTFIERNRRMFWNVRPSSGRGCADCGGMLVMSVPSSRILPDVAL